MKENLTQLLFALDSDAIPAEHSDESIEDFKILLNELEKTEKEIRVSAVTFNSTNERRIVNQPLSKVKSADFILKKDNSGACPMIDKTALMMNDIGIRLTDTPEEERPSQIILTIVVFGTDNASRHYTYEQLKDMIALQRDVYKWKFFLVTDFTRNMEKLGIADEDTIVIKKSEDDWFKRPFTELTEKMLKHIKEFKQ